MASSSTSASESAEICPRASAQETEQPTEQAQLRDRVLYSLTESLKPYEDGKAQILNPDLQPLVGQLQALRQKLMQAVLQISVFGYVSRGKSALLNALLEEPILPIGVLNGVTQWPRSIQWVPFPEANSPWKIELVDTPGLGEIEGDDRATMAMKIASASDLLLFVVAGRPSDDELKTLTQMAKTGTPLLLIANKSDLYPDLTPDQLWTELDKELQVWIPRENLLLTAANPSARKIRHEWPDGQVSQEWDVPPADVNAVRDRLQLYLTQEASETVLKNILEQAAQAQEAIAQILVNQNRNQATSLWQKYGTIKSIGVGLLPFWWLDGPFNVLMDLLLVRSLVNLYQLPANRHHVEELWRTLFFSLFGVLLSDMVSGVGLGIGAAIGGGQFHLGGILLWGSTAALQFLAASFGARKVFDVTNQYLLAGSTWSPHGPRELLEELDAVTAPPELGTVHQSQR